MCRWMGSRFQGVFRVQNTVQLTNHACYGIYVPANLRCYRPLKLTQLGSSFALASIWSLSLGTWDSLSTWRIFAFQLFMTYVKNLQLAHEPECLYCRWKVKCSTFNFTNSCQFILRMTYLKGSISRGINRTWLSWDRENYISPKVTKMGSIIGHRIDYNGVGVLRGQRHIPSKNWPK